LIINKLWKIRTGGKKYVGKKLIKNINIKKKFSYFCKLFYHTIFIMETVRTEQEQKMQVDHAEATRYMNNATDVLQKSGKEGKFYLDAKYVRMACGTAYSGVLVALDAYFEMRGIPRPPKKKRVSIDYYKFNLGKLDLKMLSHLNTVYNVLHLNGYYEGECSVSVIKAGFDSAYAIIDHIKPEHELTPDELKAIEAQRKPAWMRAMYSFFLA
jgi:hypothetical protein